MASTKIVCEEHGIRVGGCNCTGAIVKTVPCPGAASHVTLEPEPEPKAFSLSPQETLPDDYEEKARAFYEESRRI